MKFKISFFLSLLTLLVLCLTCNSVDPPPNGENPTLELTLEDVSCIEAWITLTTSNLQLPATITLKQDNQIRSTINLVKADTLIYIDSLLPNTNYTFQTIPQSSDQTSNELSVNTMDTTSHEFTFETFTFGGTAGSSTLYDVAIINENNIWAVGEILVADSSQNGYTMYNAVHWDGNQWELKQITVDFRGNLITPPLEGAFTFSATDIWFVGSLPIHGDGENWMMYDLRTTVDPNITVSKAWGSSSNDMYFVGRNGNIARYYNGTWSRIESGTDVNINDVFGAIDQASNNQKIFCAVSFVLQLGEHKILTIDENNKIDSLSWNTGRRVNSTWSNKGTIIYTSGGGVFNNKSGNWVEETTIPLYYTNRIRGNELNDIFIAGDFGLLAHFNGMRWNIYNEFLFVASSLSVSVKGDIIVAVGRQGERALIIFGRRI